MITAKDIIKIFSQIFYPPRCIYCGKITEGKALCEDCKKLERITVKTCDKCGLVKPLCDCKRNAFHFDGMVGVFYNAGKAKEIVYRFKNLADTDTADFIAESMATRIKDKLPEIKFDCVCVVPMKFSKFLKRGYNQSALIGRRVSKILDVEYLPDALSKVKKGAVQHNLEYDQRFINVRRMFKANTRFDGKTVLIIDDIRTSGATFDECARILKRAGAARVIAASALVYTQNYIEKAYKN